MRSAIVILLACLCTVPVIAQQEPFPLAKGNTWTYRAQVRWMVANTNPPVIKSSNVFWKMEVVDTVERHQLHAALLKGGPWDLAWYEPGTPAGDHAIISIGSETYLLHDQTAVRVFAKLKQGEPASDIEKELADDLWMRLPLTSGARYCTPDQQERSDGNYCWTVDSEKTVSLHVKGANSAAYDGYQMAFRTLPDIEFFTLVPQVGIVRWQYHHNGTVAEADAQLVSVHLPSAAEATSSSHR